MLLTDVRTGMSRCNSSIASFDIHVVADSADLLGEQLLQCNGFCVILIRKSVPRIAKNCVYFKWHKCDAKACYGSDFQIQIDASICQVCAICIIYVPALQYYMARS